MIRSAVVTTAFFGVLWVCGCGRFVGVLSGTMAGGRFGLFFGLLYAVTYFTVVVLVPVLLLAGAVSTALRRPASASSTT